MGPYDIHSVLGIARLNDASYNGLIMANLKLPRLGDPVLRKSTEAIPKETITSSGIQRLIDDMFQAMHDNDGVGLAAPQVGISKQLAVIELANPSRSDKAIPKTVLINPKIIACSNTLIEDWEGCLSINDMRGKVPRFEWVDLEALNRKGEKIKFHAEGFFARVIQHECDHLIGKLFIDRMPDLSSLSHLEEFARHWQDY
jgi:peptide deformylase